MTTDNKRPSEPIPDGCDFGWCGCGLCVEQEHVSTCPAAPKPVEKDSQGCPHGESIIEACDICCPSPKDST